MAPDRPEEAVPETGSEKGKSGNCWQVGREIRAEKLTCTKAPEQDKREEKGQ